MGNKYLADAEPWKLIKTDTTRVATIINTSIQIASALAVLSEPFLPFTAKKLNTILNIRSLYLKWDDVSQKKILIPAEHRLEKSQLLFQKIEDIQMEHQRDKLKKTVHQNPKEIQTIPPLKAQTSFDNFKALDLKVGEIVKAKKVKKTKKLMELSIKMGNEIRTIVSGIAIDFKADELIGKKVTILSNLAPRILKGIKSNGMILLAENQEGKFVFIHPEDTNIESGASIT